MNEKIIKVKISTPFPDWPLKRQTPGSSGKWKDCIFYINDDTTECDWWVVYDNLLQKETVSCPKENTIFITGEPPSIKKYDQKFLYQFNYIITSHNDIKHDNIVNSQQALPWMTGIKFDKDTKKWNTDNFFNYNDFLLKKIEKTKLISIITTKKNNTPGHQKRLEFIERLYKHFGRKLDIYDNNIKRYEDKWEATVDYKYHIVLENCSINDYWTEKLSDCYLAESYPFYFGCKNIQKYFDSSSLTCININNPKDAIAQIENTIKIDTYNKSLDDLKNAKKLILNKYNIFPMICNFINDRTNIKPNYTNVKIYPQKSNNYFYYIKKKFKKTIYDQ